MAHTGALTALASRVVWRDPVERGRAFGIWAACNGVAMAIGPTLGGVLIRHFGWRSIFFVVVPLSIAAMLLAIPSVSESCRRAWRGRPAVRLQLPAPGL